LGLGSARKAGERGSKSKADIWWLSPKMKKLTQIRKGVKTLLVGRWQGFFQQVGYVEGGRPFA
jgi:hypothetical protein